MKSSIVILASMLTVAGAVGCMAEMGDEVGVHQAALEAAEEEGCNTITSPVYLQGEVSQEPVAWVTMTTTDYGILFKYWVNNAEVDWRIHSLAFYATQGEVEVDPVTGTRFDLFRWQELWDVFPRPTEGSFLVTWEELINDELLLDGQDRITDISCGAQIKFVLKMKVWEMLTPQGDMGPVLKGWMEGEYDYPNHDFAQYFNYEIGCCDDPEEPSGCTLTKGYWKNHNDFARGKRRIDWPAVGFDEQDLLCEGETRTNLELISQPVAGGDAYLILASQYLAAQQNVASGASTTEQVDQALAEAAVLLNENCGQFVHASSEAGQLMLIWSEILDGYNNGIVGPGHCSGENYPGRD